MSAPRPPRPRIGSAAHRVGTPAAGGSFTILAVDCDGCRLTGTPAGVSPGTAISLSPPDSIAHGDWPAIIAAGRLGDVAGSFAIAWRDAEGGIHLARDGVGGRSVFYAVEGDMLVFASSIGDLLAGAPGRRGLDLHAVALYLATAFVPGRRTLLAGVHELLPGEQVSLGPGGLTRRTVWRLPDGPLSGAGEDVLRAELRQHLETAVAACLSPEGEPVAATLSGGLDSSLVVALARRLHDGPLAAFSVSFGHGHANELAWSGLVAKHCGIPHHVVEVTPADVLGELDHTIARLSDPIGDPLTVPNTLLFRAAAQHAGIVLNGEGGDPCFGGPKNVPMLLAELYGEEGAAPARAASYLRAHLKCYDDLADMLCPQVLEAIAAEPLEKGLAVMLDDPRWPDLLTRLHAINIRLKGAHHILPKVDALSAPFGVLPRSPLFDRPVVELAMRLPPQMKLNGAVEKYLLKEAVRDLLPAAVLERPKSGMLVPVEAWCRGPLLAAARERLLDGLGPRRLVRRDWLERLLAGRLPGLRPRHGAKIWLLLTLEAWLRRVADRR